MSSSAQRVLERIARAAEKAGRKPQEVRLLPVSKSQSLENIVAAFRETPALPHRLGENYLDEMATKHAELGAKFEWHFIGRLQSRKIREICAIADYVHTVSRSKELIEIARQARRPKFFLQMNVSQQDQKNGCSESELPLLLEDCARLGLESQLEGLMTLPSDLEIVGEAKLRSEFSQLRKLRDRYLPNKSLSMGMSGDFEIAISEGSDWVRIGSAVFGARHYAAQ